MICYFLQIADLLVLLICTPTVLVEVNSAPEVWMLGEEMCKSIIVKKNMLDTHENRFRHLNYQYDLFSY